MFLCNGTMSERLCFNERKKRFKEKNIIFLTKKLGEYSRRERRQI